MANLLWGNVYYQDQFAGVLREESLGRMVFEYDAAYVQAGAPAIAHTFPLSATPYISEGGLHPFFDNLVSEGWLEQAQVRLLGGRQVSRFSLLLAFGYDCAGAVSIMDPSPVKLTERLTDPSDSKAWAVLTSRASLSGVQPKLAVVVREGKYYPTHPGELSTHIAKFPSAGHNDLVINEYLICRALKALLPDDDIADVSIGAVEGIADMALLIKRFDRSPAGRIHFEEFNQLLALPSGAKYEGSYKNMSDFIRSTPRCLPVENYRLYARIITGLLLGNTDMHFKNFAMFHTTAGLRLTPSYDQVAASIYKYNTVALAISGARDLLLGDLKPKHLIALAKEFTLPMNAVDIIFKQLLHRKEVAKEAIASAAFGPDTLKNQLIKLLETRWRGTFALIGQILLKKR